MPAITATSAWSSAGSNYYFTYSTVIQKANDGFRDFYYACMQYRCSENQENTNVYLNIDIPMKDMTQEPAFNCVGPCFEARCIADGSSIEGAFTAPELVAGKNGPDYYVDINVADCSSRNSYEAFAYMFYCSAGDVIFAKK
ncbi:hypothetical protein DPMN_050645 [Dreissena polymorpha]|uniref:Uncharacterized protein n=1 Tax=Dreissena polymorpha TaxID=45954 RepID=A0A9D4CGI4_DREPO|nr:hypothetical protein DPMN_050645 [Dreissena polymorpha]